MAPEDITNERPEGNNTLRNYYELDNSVRHPYTYSRFAL